ncbi:TadE/TadG family type IV pilus assembly protein [Oceanobacillus halotolerans]|uniref:TadE/TadG family type IV pilus assembly protein n=1 Tax=Oceanobacillus halotolerans TaxID=2663380 RepID=UPI001CF7BFB4|nr:TadE/TadG family type IV pilus assembly protein [Oceanobacillus halotolerans]
MRSIFKRLKRQEKGNIALLMAVALGGMLLMVGLVIDGGHLFMSKSHLQKTANAAALSGAQEIPNTEAAVNQVVADVLASHEETTSLQESVIEQGKQVKVVLQKEVPVFFATLFGVDSIPITVKATASLQVMGAAKDAVPLGVDESVELIPGKIYELKVDAGDSISGNFGVLALEGPGAKLYGETLKEGFGEQIKVGDIINTQTGNIAGATREGIKHRIDNCPYPSGEYHHRDCSRIMLVLVYKPHSQTTNQLKSVEVTGFAYFYITEPMSNNDTSIKGEFIERAGTGLPAQQTVNDRGAYTITLIE